MRACDYNHLKKKKILPDKIPAKLLATADLGMSGQNWLNVALIVSGLSDISGFDLALQQKVSRNNK